MPRQGDGYWIDGKTGQIAKVHRHEQWLMDPTNLADFGLEKLQEVLDQYDKSDIDAIRIAGMQAGLVRTRNNQGTISIQFYAPRGLVSKFLENTALALQSVKEYGMGAWIHNLHYDDMVSVPWQEFVQKATAGVPLLIHEDKDAAVDDVPYNPVLMKQIKHQLQRAGLDPRK